MNRTVCFTLDVEPDFGGLLIRDTYFGKKDLPKLERIVEKYNIKVTAFATGKTLEDNPDILDSLRSMNAEIEQHSYSHQVTCNKYSDYDSKIKDIEKGIEAHEKIVGKSPIGYRAPLGIISREEAAFLEKMDIKFDSSIFPAFFPGRFNRMRFPNVPFRIKDSNLLEIPLTVVPKIKMPIGLAYMHMLGLNTFKILFALFGLPEIVVYDFHIYQLGKVSSYNILPTIAKFGYYRAQNLYSEPAKVFEDFVEYILSKGYESKYMYDVYNEGKSTGSWKWEGD